MKNYTYLKNGKVYHNHLQSYLDVLNNIPSISAPKQQEYYHYADMQYVFENKVVTFASPRQSGITSCIEQIFDPLCDVYVGYRIENVRMFESNVKKKIKYCTIRQHNADGLRGLDFGCNQIRVFIDIGGAYVNLRYAKEITEKIEQIYNVLPKGRDVLFILT